MSDNALITNSQIKKRAKRNEKFAEGHEPLASHEHLQRKEGATTGPFGFLNPTKASFHGIAKAAAALSKKKKSQEAAEEGSESEKAPQSDAVFRWRARDNRKGRHAIAVPRKESPYGSLEPTSTFKATMKGIWRMMTVFPVWDISWLVAIIFTFGSILWCINGCFVYFPLIMPKSEFKNEIKVGGGWTAFLGATVFEFGSWLMMLEVINQHRGGCFGWAVEHAIDKRVNKDDDVGADAVNNEGHKVVRLRPDKKGCAHHHQEKKFTGDTWQWYPSWADVKSHYIRELGFLATFSQLTGATIFWISGFTALPQLNPSHQPLADGIYWTPQVIGGSGFIVSGILFLLETQERWYKPAFKTLGWHIAFWNFIGGVGFTLSGAFGYSTADWAKYQCALSTFWGSWAFLIGSVIQWYESLSKFPVEYHDEKKKEKEEKKLNGGQLKDSNNNNNNNNNNNEEDDVDGNNNNEEPNNKRASLASVTEDNKRSSITGDDQV